MSFDKRTLKLYKQVDSIFERCRSRADLLAEEILRAAQGNKMELARMIRNAALVAFPRHPQLIRASRRLPMDYDDQFYGRLIQDSRVAAEAILLVVRKHLRFRSVVDFGCGLGAWLEAARKLGAAYAYGIEGTWARSADRFQEADYLFQDLNKRVRLSTKYDLAICVEVAEHLNPSRSRSLVADLCASSDVIVFGAALPRQYGDGHFNCRPQQFWIDTFAAKGFSCHDLFRPIFWFDGTIAPWYRQNTFLFCSRARRRRFRGIASPLMRDLYQPALLFPPVRSYVVSDHEIRNAAL